jgi:hypothetical protein
MYGEVIYTFDDLCESMTRMQAIQAEDYERIKAREAEAEAMAATLRQVADCKASPLVLVEPRSFSPEALRFAYSVLCQPQTAHLSVTEQVRIKYAVCQAWEDAHPKAQAEPERKPGVKPFINGLLAVSEV